MEDQRIIELLADISKDLKRVANLLEDKRSDLPPEEKKWIDRLEVQELLRKSESTIKRYTKKGILKPRRIGKENFYWKPDIFKQWHRFLK